MNHIADSQRLQVPSMKTHISFSPVMLRYVAALRGVVPAHGPFAYADAACRDAERLVCLAASNPEGDFFGLVADEAARAEAARQAAARGVGNVTFVAGGSHVLPMLDFLVADTGGAAIAPAMRDALADLAQSRLKPGGLFAFSYRAYDRADGALRFVMRELAPEMNAAQKEEFLIEIRKLAADYLAAHAEVAQALKDAIVRGAAQPFIDAMTREPAPSATFDALVAMGKRGFAYAGDGALQSNYVELAVPAEAQELVVKCRGHVLYEPIKDLALGRTVRNDVWVKNPARLSADPAELFGGFAYGVLGGQAEIPASFAARGKNIDLSGPLYGKLVNLMALMPVGVGDFLSHPDGAGEDPKKVVEALQILVACGVALPMRGMREGVRTGNVAQPRLRGNFNRYLDKTDLAGGEVWFASPALGCGVTLDARDALVIQALNRAGLANSVSALLPELRRLAATPAAAAILQAREPTGEIAQQLVRDVVGASLPQWYAYGLMEAA